VKRSRQVQAEPLGVPKRPHRKSDRSACLFVVSNEPPSTKLIEWPEYEAEAAALRAQARRIGDEYRALPAARHDDPRWCETTVRMLTAVIEYERVHADAHQSVGGKYSYSDGFRRFVMALVRGLGEGMNPAELAWATSVPVGILTEWLKSETPP
jgi:hypothetical protein